MPSNAIEKLMELMKTTDEKHPVFLFEIINRLKEMNIDCDENRALKLISLASTQGYSLKSKLKGFKRAYYLSERLFDDTELRMLSDAVLSSRFISDKNTDTLISKLNSISSGTNLMKRGIVNAYGKSNRLDDIYSTLYVISEAIHDEKQIIFRYFDLNEKGERIFRHDAVNYTVEPLYIVLSDEHYYIIAYSSKYSDLCHYRIDRMYMCKESGDYISNNAKIAKENLDIEEYLRESFGMFGGKSTEIELVADNTKINALFDRYGENIPIKRIDESFVSTKLMLQPSPKFYGWLVQQEGRIYIASPRSQVEAYREYLNMLLKNLSQNEIFKL